MAETPFLWGRGGRKLTPDQIEKERQTAALLAKGAMDYSPVAHWSQGLNRVAQGLLAGIDYRMADKAEADNAEVNKGLIASLLAGGSGSASPSSSASIPMSGAAGEIAATSPASTGPQAYRDAIASIESAGSGDYGAIGPTNDKLGRALGRYQIMEANIGPWSQEALGRAVTADEFLADPALQDAIFDHRFGQYVNQFGPEGAAQAWFAGPGGVGKTGRSDVLGTTVGEYGQRFTNALGGASATPAQAAIEAVAPEAAGEIAMQPAETAQTVQAAGGGDRVPMTGNTGINPAIIEALTNPQASPQTQRIAGILLQQDQARQNAAIDEQNWRARQAYEQELQANDPVRKLQLEKGQLEVDALRNPQAKIPDSVQALDLRAQRAGLQPGTPEYERFMLSGGDKGITINNEGTIPAGYQAVRDAEGRVTAIQPIPGSPAALEMEQALKTKENQGGRKETATDVITNAASNARNILKNNNLVTGTPGKLASYLSESPAAELRRQVGVLKSQATIETLTAMRQASPTGGALGSVTEKEGAMLAAAAGAIDPDGSLPDVQKSLDNYEHTLLRVIHGPKVGDAIFEQTRQPDEVQTDIPGVKIRRKN